MSSLSGVLRSPRSEDDHLESARRELLCRFERGVPTFTTTPLTEGIHRRLMDVIIKLEPLSEQNGLLKFLRNEDHTALLEGFIRDIANAVAEYQVCSPEHAIQGY